MTNSISSSLPEAQDFDGCSNALEVWFCAQLPSGLTGGVGWDVKASFVGVWVCWGVGWDKDLLVLASSEEDSEEEDEGRRCFGWLCLQEVVGAEKGDLGVGFWGASCSSLLLLLLLETRWATGGFFGFSGWSTLTGEFLVDAADLTFFSLFFFFFFFSWTDAFFTSCFSTLLFFFRSTPALFSSFWCSSACLRLFLVLLFTFSGTLLSPFTRSRYSSLTLKFLKEKNNYFKVYLSLCLHSTNFKLQLPWQ